MSATLIQDDKLYFSALLEHVPCYRGLNPWDVMCAAADQDIEALQAGQRQFPDAYMPEQGPRFQDIIGLMACRNDWPLTLNWAMQHHFDPFKRVIVIPGRDGADSALIVPWLQALEGGAGNVIAHLKDARGVQILNELVSRHQNMITPLMHLFDCGHTAVALQILDRHPELIDQPISWHPSDDFKLLDYVRAYGREGQGLALQSWMAANAARAAISEISSMSALAVP